MRKRLSRIIKNGFILPLLAIGITEFSVYTVSSYFSKLTSKDFAKAKWIEYDNPNRRLWEPYTREFKGKNGIKPSVNNWAVYQREVKNKNGRGKNEELPMRILLPDLNSDGKVGVY